MKENLKLIAKEVKKIHIMAHSDNIDDEYCSTDLTLKVEGKILGSKIGRSIQ